MKPREVSDMSAIDGRHREADERLTPEAFWRWAWSSIRPYLGHFLVVVGLVLLVVAYFGVSRETFVARQIPYLISGGLFGLAAVTLGSRLMLIEDLRRDSGRLERLEVAVTELRAALLVRTDYPSDDSFERIGSSGSRNGATSADSTGELSTIKDNVVVLSGGQTFHRAECQMVTGKKTSRRIGRDTAQTKGLAACKLCQPLSVGV